MELKEFVESLTKQQEDNIRQTFQHLHQNPELSFAEYNTAQYIRTKLKDMGIELMKGISGTSTVGILKGTQPGPTIGFRADIDALPVQEENNLPYKSNVDNVMHACGHDSHTATLLSFAAIMANHPQLVKGTIKFIFQAAEEKLPGGAKQMVADHAIDDCDMLFAFHCTSGQPVGTVIINKGPLSAAIATYEVVINGAGGHGSSPYKAINPVPIACMVGNALNQIIPEKINPLRPAVLTVSYIEGGQYPNVIASQAKLGGNIRVLDNSLLDTILDNISKIATGICECYGATCTIDITRGYPANINSDQQVEIVQSAVSELGYNIIHTEPGLGGEDFAYFAMRKPSAYFSIGSADPQRVETSSPHHSCAFQLDQRMLDIALQCEVATYLKATKQY